MAPFRQQVSGELAEAGYRPQDIDPAHLDDAAGRLYRREHDSGADAYEASVMGRDGAGVQPAVQGSGPISAVPFDGAAGAAGAFPGGDTSAIEAMRRARGLFRDYKQAFAPRSPTDGAGKNLARIVEQDSTPNEVAGMLFGQPSGRVTGRQLETLDRLRDAVGEDSPAWAAVRQATMGRYLEGRDVGRSLDYLLRGEGRDLAERVLTPQQRAGLDAFRVGSQQAERARAATPEWVSDIARTGYDGNKVLADLFGSGIPGARPGSAAYGRGLRQYLGADSPEWSGLRQAAWQRLTGEGQRLQPRVEAERIRAFTGGQGKGLAGAMFSPEELAQMNRYAEAVAATDVPRGGRLPDGGRSKALAGHVLNMIATGTMGHVFGPLAGAVTGYASRLGQHRRLQGGARVQRRRPAGRRGLTILRHPGRWRGRSRRRPDRSGDGAMSGGFGSVPSFTGSDAPGLSPDLLATLRAQQPQAMTLPAITADVPGAAPPSPGFMGSGVPQAGATTIPTVPSGFGGQAAPAKGGSGYTSRVVGVESNGNDFAKNPLSSATGAGQFINSTWLDHVRKNRPDLAGLPDAQILAMRSDPVLSRQMVDAYGNENGAKLRAAGLPDNDGTRYLSHFLGSGAARSVLSADPSSPIGQVLAAGQINANPHIRNMTAGQVVDWAAQKMAGAGGGNPPSMTLTPGSANPLGMSAGSTAQRGGFGLSGIEAHGAAMPGQASATPGLASLSAQPMTAFSVPAGTYGGGGVGNAAVQQPSLMDRFLQGAGIGGLGGGQGKGQDQSKAKAPGMPAIEAPGGRGMTLGEAYKQFDPSQFIKVLRGHGIGR